MCRKQKVLSLKEIVDVIRKFDKGNSCHTISSEIGVGKTQVQSIVRDREDILKRWESG